MKKIITIFILITFILTTYNKTKQVLIPKDAIRFRIIASSNSKEDQETKLLLRDKLEKVIMNDLNNKDTIIDTRKTLINNTDKYSNIIYKTLKDNKINTDFNINYGINYFPEKEYKGVTYPEGNYESLVVTLGEGIGNNWWCCLFPPLCLLETEENENDEVEYKFFVKELIDKLFK